MALNKLIANDTKESYKFPSLVSFYLSHTYASHIKLYMFTNLRLATCTW